MKTLEKSSLDTTPFAPNRPSLTVRLEREEDAGWINALHDACFGPTRFGRAAFRIRDRYGVEPKLCLVAELEGEPVANVKMAPISIAGLNGYLLGPLATDPNRRKLGAGKLLVNEVCKRAFKKRGCSFVLLVGDPPYYGPLGFEPTSRDAISFPAPVDAHRVLVRVKDKGMVNRLKGSIYPWDNQ
jgi:predicted N-acetyltransferase YhbS